MIVVSDTSPIFYLLLISQLELLPFLYQRILIPEVVRDEMLATGAPVILQRWIGDPPSWLEICVVELLPESNLMRLDQGERAAIQLAQQVKANLLLIDDKPARQTAIRLGIQITGLLGILDEATKLNQINLLATLDRLRETNFRAAPNLIQALLSKHNLIV
jgi:predicted nucleic acid-binding protein